MSNAHPKLEFYLKNGSKNEFKTRMTSDIYETYQEHDIFESASCENGSKIKLHWFGEEVCLEKS